MSTQPHDVAPENVADMAGFLEDTLRRLDQIEGFVQEARARIKAQLYALHVARDPKTQEWVNEIEKLLETGDPIDTISGDELAKKYDSWKAKNPS
jgi:hypothetical protein